MEPTSNEIVSDYLGSYMKELREMADISRETAAKRSGVTTASVSAYENGKQRMPVVIFLRLCALYRVDPLVVVTDILNDNNVAPFLR